MQLSVDNMNQPTNGKNEKKEHQLFREQRTETRVWARTHQHKNVHMKKTPFLVAQINIRLCAKGEKNATMIPIRKIFMPERWTKNRKNGRYQTN